jgi:hypothetical protein
MESADPTEGAEPTSGPATVETLEQLELRTLREQLRALEQVVQEQVSESPGAALARVEEAAAVQSAAYLRQVSLVVQGLAAHAPQEEDPQRTLARVAAAVERLGAPNAMQRPVLPVTTQPPSRRLPSHVREVPELEGRSSEPEADPVADVFSNLDVAGRQFQPAAVEVPEAAVEPEPADQVLAAPPRLAPATGPLQASAPPMLSDEAAEVAPPLDEVPSAHEQDRVLPVPPPAVIPLEPRRRGLRRTST